MDYQEQYNQKFGVYPPEPNGYHDVFEVMELLEKLSKLSIERNKELHQDEVDKAIGFDPRLNKPTVKF